MMNRVNPLSSRVWANRTAGLVHRPLGLVLAVWLLGVFLIFPSLGAPQAIVFDETFMIPRAQAYLNGVYFDESHPPLGRLWIALGQWMMHPDEPAGDYANVEQIREDWPVNTDIRGYRLIPALFGTLIPGVVLLIVLAITSSEVLALTAALLVLFDNALLTQSRFALSDSGLVLFSLAALLCYLWLGNHMESPRGRKIAVWAAMGIFASAAFMTKLTGLFILLILPFHILRLWRANLHREIAAFLVFFSITFLVFSLLVWDIHFSLFDSLPAVSEGSRISSSAGRFIVQIEKAYRYMFEYHEHVPVLNLQNPGELGSAWYTWPFGGRPMPYRWEIGPEKARMIFLVGNPVTWLVSLVGVVGASSAMIADLFFHFLEQEQRKKFHPILVLYWGYLLSVAAIPRVMYLYHYLLPLILGGILFVLLVVESRWNHNRAGRWILGGLLVCLLVGFLLFSPFTYYLEFPIALLHRINLWTIWGLRCPGC
jgi:dolichyl-phosphate-mannose--protein O-mannosyl transferase